jgi:hypothetical protein
VGAEAGLIFSKMYPSHINTKWRLAPVIMCPHGGASGISSHTVQMHPLVPDAKIPYTNGV